MKRIKESIKPNLEDIRNLDKQKIESAPGGQPQSKKSQQNANRVSHAYNAPNNEFCIYEDESQNSSSSSSERKSQESSFEVDKSLLNQKEQDKENIDKLLLRLGLRNRSNVSSKNDDLELVVNNFVENCIGVVNNQENISDYSKKFDQKYNEKTKAKQEITSIFVNEFSALEIINQMSDSGLYGILKYIRTLMKRISLFCEAIVEHSIFEAIVLIVIVLNSLKMATDNPLATTTSNPAFQTFFTVFYASQMVLKILAYGFVLNEGSYLRSLWNVLDFIIVCTSLLPLVITIGFSVSSLRAVRVLRPLKTITKIKALKMIVRTLFHSFSLVMDSLYILLFVMFVLAIAGSQLYGGKLKNRCMEEETGILSTTICSTDTDCASDYICAKGIESPNFSITNFDTFFWSFLAVYRTLSLEYWSSIMQDIQMSNGFVHCLYSVLIVFICEYVLLNMTLAILKYKYAQVKQNVIEDEQQQVNQYEIDYLKKIGIYEDLSKLVKEPDLIRMKSEQKVFVGCSESAQSLESKNAQSRIPLASLLQEARQSQKVSFAKLKTVKIDISQLKHLGKVSDQKWDAKNLQFEINEFDPYSKKNGNDFQDKEDSEQSQDDIDDKTGENYSIDDDEQDSYRGSELSSLNHIQQIEITDRAHQIQKKLNQSSKQIPGQLKPPGNQNIQSKKTSNLLLPPSKPKQKAVKLSSNLDMLLQKIGKSQLKQVKNQKNQLNIPDIELTEFPHYQVESLYKRFDDLGDFKIKRIEKKNELQFFEINHNKKKPIKEIKKSQNLLKEIVEENSLDIKELHLKNQLQKKRLKCRIKNSEILNESNTYDMTRVIVSEKVREIEKKKEEIKENMNTLKFHIKFKQPIKQSDKQPTLDYYDIFYRSIVTETNSLKIPEMISIKQVKTIIPIKIGTQAYLKKDNEYLKLLQNHQMDEKIELSFDRVMAAFFKKSKSPNVNTELDAQQTEEEQKQMTFEEEYNKIKQDDILKKHGHLILDFPTQNVSSQILQMMNMKAEQYEIYVKGIFGIINVMRKKTLLFISREAYDNFMLVVVLVNTVLMSLTGLVNTDQNPYAMINSVCSYFFMSDLALKLIAYGFSFFGDIMNIFDSMVVCISIIEMTLGSSSLSALKSIKVLRAFRVLRITRLIRTLSFMKIVMEVVGSIINEFVYIFMLLFLFIFIYTLLGMQIFGGNLLPQSVTGIRQNFDTFLDALQAAFQVVTIENWNDIETAIISSMSPWFDVYLISLMFVGNWILMNLLQAILLDGFDKDSKDADQEEQEKDEEQAVEDEAPAQPQSQKPQTNVSVSNIGTEIQGGEIKSEGAENASLYIFMPNNFIRYACIKLVNSSIFEAFIFIAIIFSSIKLAMDSYIQPGTSLDSFSQTADYVFNFIFIFQCIVKVISNGLVIGEHAYLKNSWSKLDFFIVIISIIDMLLSQVNLSILKLFRTLRPLRIISRNQEMKIIIISLGESIYGITNVVIIILCVFLMFGILGMNLLQGKLNFCNTTPDLAQANYYGPYNITQAQCLEQGGQWVTQFTNFQNILNSLLTLYVFSTRQNWPFYVFTFMDASDTGPILYNNQLLFLIFAIIFIFTGSYFFMDLLVGVLFMNYHEAESKIKPQTLTDKQINWQNLQKVIISEDPCFSLFLQPQNKLKKIFFKIVTWKYFQGFTTACILANILVMMIGNDDDPASFTSQLSFANSIFSFIFLTELVLKLLAFSKNYFLSSWNIFDFFVVGASVLDLILQWTGSKSSGSSAISVLPQIARIFRVLRITRVLRLFKSFKGLQKLIQTFVFSLPAIGRGLSILFLYLFIASVLAAYLFNDVITDYSGNMDIVKNYWDFHHCLQLLFINITGQNWYIYMYELATPNYVQCAEGVSECWSSVYFVFFLPFIFFGQKVFLQLFVLIVLDQFEANYIRQNNPLGVFALYEDDFRQKWIETTAKYHSQKIESKRLIDLLMILRPPLGLNRGQLLSKYEEELNQNDKITKSEVEVRLQQLDLKLKKNAAKLLHKMNVIKNRIYFGYHQTFYHFAKLAIATQFYDESNKFQKEKLDQMHKESEEALEKLKPAGNLYYYEEEADNMSAKDVEPLNPISLILFTQMIVKSWHNYSVKYHRQKNAESNKIDNLIGYESLNNSCASDLSEAKYEKLQNQKKYLFRRGGMMENKGDQKENQIFNLQMPNINAHYSDTRKVKPKYSICNRNQSNKKSRMSKDMRMEARVSKMIKEEERQSVIKK